MRRKMAFPAGIAVGDTAAIPNTAGYFMTPSQPTPDTPTQAPGAAFELVLDDIDRPRARR